MSSTIGCLCVAMIIGGLKLHPLPTILHRTLLIHLLEVE